MVAYTAAFLAAANLLALAQAAPAQPVCKVVTTVITGSPVWVPRADPTTGGWGAWPNNGGNKGPSVVTTTTSTYSTPTTWTGGITWTPTTWTGGITFTSPTSSISPVSTITLTGSLSSPSVTIITTPTPDPVTPTPDPVVISTTTTPPAPVATCDTTTHNVFDLGASGSCNCDYTVNCNKHSPYGAGTSFWERTTGEIIATLQDCVNICDDNSACTAVVWSNQDGESSSDYMRCWQTSGLPQPDSDGYGQLTYKGACSGTCANSYTS